MIPDTIEREVVLNHPIEKVWQAISTAEGLAGWFGSHAEIDLRPGGRAWFRWEQHNIEDEAEITIVEPPRRLGFRWRMQGLPPDHPHRNEAVFTLTPVPEGTRLTLVESGFAQVAEEFGRAAYKDNTEGWDAELADLVAYLDGRG